MVLILIIDVTHFKKVMYTVLVPLPSLVRPDLDQTDIVLEWQSHNS